MLGCAGRYEDESRGRVIGSDEGRPTFFDLRFWLGGTFLSLSFLCF